MSFGHCKPDSIVPLPLVLTMPATLQVSGKQSKRWKVYIHRMTVETLELRVHLLPHLAISQASVALEQARPFKVSSRCTNILCTAQCLHAPLQSSCRKSQGFLKLPCMQFQTCHLYYAYIHPMCARSVSAPVRHLFWDLAWLRPRFIWT